jgi:hypothetical protein
MKTVGYWARVGKLLNILKPGRLYKYEIETVLSSVNPSPHPIWAIVTPYSYKLVSVVLHILATNSPVKEWQWPKITLGYNWFDRTRAKITPIKQKDLPLYIGSDYIGPLFEQYLSGKKKVKDVIFTEKKS